MIGVPFKRAFGLVGAVRSGKDSVANFLVETRGFVPLAFADQIKEEFWCTQHIESAIKFVNQHHTWQENKQQFIHNINRRDTFRKENFSQSLPELKEMLHG